MPARRPDRAVCAQLVALMLGAQAASAAFVNWENPHVHPLDMTPDGSHLLAVNTADGRLEIFTLVGDHLVPTEAVEVGLDPVSVRAYSDQYAWVVNHISDSISVVDLAARRVVATLATDDEPADVVFAGSPRRAFVSCAQANTVLVFDPLDLSAAPARIPIAAEEPRALAVSSDGAEVYVAIFESGNGTTILGGGSSMGGAFPPNVVSHPSGPYGGVNPPPNDGANFRPPQRAGNPPPPAVGLIVRKSGAGFWLDDNGGDWTNFVSGANAGLSGRPVGWDLPDRDIAIIDTATLQVRYATRLMNICMSLAVNPATGAVTVVGTDAVNETRFEPLVSGRFLRVNFASVNPAGPTTSVITDLNGHLSYTDAIPFTPIPQTERDKSIGDPRAVVWHASGDRGYVAGMGSNNLIIIDASGARIGQQPTIEVGEGPTGLVLDEDRQRLFVLNKFSASITIVDTVAETAIAEVSFPDPTPPTIRTGRKHLYDTQRSSGLGHISCASCHVDARIDRLAWDLGDPNGLVKTFNQNCPDGGCQNWHPMKGPMLTQTLQDIIGKEPHHWRGDREGLEAFAAAFQTLLGDDAALPPAEMQEFEDFLATIHFPPNPYRNFDNTLPTSLPLPGHFTTGRFGAAGSPLPNGNAQAGLLNYRTGNLDAVQCATCHTLPAGVGPNGTIVGLQFQTIPPGPNGELHHAVVSVDGSTNVTMKIPQLRNLYERVGFETTQTSNQAGFGFLHDGSVDSIARFVTEPVFSLASDQEVADMVAFMLAFSGSDLPQGSPLNPLELPGPPSKDTHAAVGRQTTLVDAAGASPAQLALIASMVALAESDAVGLIVKGRVGGVARGYAYVGGGMCQSDRAAETVTIADLQNAATIGGELTFTVVPAGSETRIGIDRDEDGHFDRDELDACSDPADPSVVPGTPPEFADANRDGDVDSSDVIAFLACQTGPTGTASALCACVFDADADGTVDTGDFAALQRVFTSP